MIGVLNNNSYYVVVVKYTDADGQEYYSAYTETIPNSSNLVSLFERTKGLIIIHAADTKKGAKELADFWNECYEKNGTYLYAKENSEILDKYCHAKGGFYEIV